MGELLPQLSITTSGIVTKEFYAKHWVFLQFKGKKIKKIAKDGRTVIKYLGMRGGSVEQGVLDCTNHRRFTKFYQGTGFLTPYYKDGYTYIYNSGNDSANLLIAVVSSSNIENSGIYSEEEFDFDNSYIQYTDE